MDEVDLYLQVVGWSQTITHGENWPPYQFRVIAHTSGDEELVFGADGYQRLRNMPVHLTLVRGRPQTVLERGIGVFTYHPETPASLDFKGLDEFVTGWFWLPEALYDEIWAQARDQHYDESVVELEFGPVESAGPTFRWNTEKNKVASIMRAGVRFERKLKALTTPDARRRRSPQHIDRRATEAKLPHQTQLFQQRSSTVWGRPRTSVRCTGMFRRRR
jgi:hypothetical protein